MEFEDHNLFSIAFQLKLCHSRDSFFLIRWLIHLCLFQRFIFLYWITNQSLPSLEIYSPLLDDQSLIPRSINSNKALVSDFNYSLCPNISPYYFPNSPNRSNLSSGRDGNQIQIQWVCAKIPKMVSVITCLMCLGLGIGKYSQNCIDTSVFIYLFV